MSENQVPSQVVVVTGASSGIGKETALRFAGRGARLVLAARNEDALQRVADECLEAGARGVLLHRTDIADHADVEALFGVATAFGPIDIVVQSAAITAFGRFEDVPPDVFDSIVRTNIIGSANVARCALTHFHQAGSGHLILIGSLLGSAAFPYQSAYVASKFALHGLVRVLRQENRARPGIKIHGVYPGPVDTPVYQTASNYYGRTPRVPPTAVSPSTVVSAIVRATDRRRSSERQVGLANRPVIAMYRLLPSVFDALVGPLVRAVSFTSESTEASEGNAFAQPDRSS
ncbi:SDR family NAD(P)-dependent oxidoreductase [Mycolicibacterium sp. S2-37]|uniref:SDR family NAD(P)-dependent oxidoreductase n=1 Tax=Mycolicibacterium sp. S2-37 TaxID=2810297 RepID=UPI001A952728|nr:SDR family NAD(P)-dependent oxidoreductase [Mycolicibacterium sp. S2-37]MBO0681289.1 SDR family NAD(P)-dependent oxidoreductase [Mycolicibacterium sp. S2-37]